VAGTFDRIVTVPGVGQVTADLKCGKTLEFSWLDYTIQLALYAHSPLIWDGLTKTYAQMSPKLRTDKGLIIHLPSGQARCSMHWVDLEAGWELAKLAGQVRTARAGAKTLASPFKAEKPKAAPKTPAAQPVAPPQAKANGAHTVLLAAITDAPTIAELYRLWEHSQKGVWTPEMTAAAAARKKQLLKETA